MSTLSDREYAQRRQRLMGAVEADAVLLVPAATLKYRNRDAEYGFRQNSDFLYLTGFNEPDALLVLLPGKSGGEVVLFCQPRDPEKEVWTGYRPGPEGAMQRFGMDRAFSLEQLDDELPQLLQGRSRIYCPLADETLQGRLAGWRQRLMQRCRDAQQVPQQLQELGGPLHELRLFKTAAEQALIRASGELSAQAHCRAMRACRPGLYEYQLEAEIHHQFAMGGSRVPAYGTIVGSGANGCILHYTQNQDRLEAGELVLIDAGAELEGYAGDITRTFPVNGRFSDRQRALYEVVLAAQEAAIAAVQPGNSFNAPHEAAVAVLTEGLVRLGLLEGEVDALLAEEAYTAFYIHRTSHWLGLDVHDVGAYRRDGQWRNLEPGMVLTIEPGLYIAPDDERVDPAWRGMGIRIEDDLLVTGSGHEVLTAGVPKAVAAIEALMAEGRA
ncbi:Xaa-Pro aminopeptidase [Motiliproteus sp. SC1-56]|uniref:Xaa-Pro aminopeptidase n=1 Tax=Motiliproteus sp. SC1-56 TaxID=2799565 RepID=UPI001A8C3CEC|nr:Xaa-Pro aminopeptidase [Motiliproteus sp. SC1-56]